MEKKLIFNNVFEIIQKNNNYLVNINFRDKFPYKFLICMNLLIENLINILILIDKKTKSKIKIQKKDHNEFLVDENNNINLFISQDALEYWLFYFLKYFRDEFAEVDHIHTDFLMNNKYELDLTILIDKNKAAELLSDYELFDLLDD